MLRKLVEFLKTALVEKQFNAFPSGQLTLAMLPFATLRSPALFSSSMAATEFLKTVHIVERIAF